MSAFRPMLNSAQEARQRARQGAAAHRLVNHLVPAALAAGSARGETVVLVNLDSIALKPVSGRLGRINGWSLCQALDDSGQQTLAIACGKLLALGFSLSTVVNAEMQTDERSVVDRVRSLQMDHLILDYTTAQHAPATNTNPLLQGVTLKHAAHWCARAQVQLTLRHKEASALALIDTAAARGHMDCRVAWRDLSKAHVQPEQLDRLASQLRGRGFQIQLIEAATAFRVTW